SRLSKGAPAGGSPTGPSQGRSREEPAMAPKKETKASTIDASPGPKSVASPSPDPLAAFAAALIALEQRRKITLAGIYQQARVLSWQNGLLELGFPADVASSEMAGDADNVREVSEFLTEHTGQPTKVKITMLNQSQMQQGNTRS